MLFSTATVLSTSIGPTTGRMVVTRSIQAKIAIIFIFIASTFYLPAYIPPLPIRAVIRNSAYLYILPRKDLKCDYHLICCLCPLLPVFHVFFLLLCQRVYFNAHCRKLPPCTPLSACLFQRPLQKASSLQPPCRFHQEPNKLCFPNFFHC